MFLTLHVYRDKQSAQCSAAQHSTSTHRAIPFPFPSLRYTPTHQPAVGPCRSLQLQCLSRVVWLCCVLAATALLPLLPCTADCSYSSQPPEFLVARGPVGDTSQWCKCLKKNKKKSQNISLFSTQKSALRIKITAHWIWAKRKEEVDVVRGNFWFRRSDKEWCCAPVKVHSMSTNRKSLSPSGGNFNSHFKN